MKKDKTELRPQDKGKKKLSVEELEARLAPAATTDKKVPTPPYPPGALYGLVRRDHLNY